MAERSKSRFVVACLTLVIFLGAMVVLRVRLQIEPYANLLRTIRGHIGEWVRLDGLILLLVAAIVGVALVSRSLRPSTIWKEFGLHRPLLPALVFALVATSPMMIGLGVTGTFSPDWSLLALAGFGPFVEEVFFRGFAYRQLDERAGWGFWPAALVTGVVFGLGHVEPDRLMKLSLDGDDIMAALLTGVGGVWFAWLFMQWRFNLWSVILLHMFMNLWWTLFDTQGDTVGTGTANIFRVLAIAAATVLAIFAHRLPFLKRGLVEE